jgi:hypothetical protein
VSSKPKKITVLLDSVEFSQFDQFCREHGFKKSTLLAKLLREFLERETAGRKDDLPLFERSPGTQRKY